MKQIAPDVVFLYSGSVILKGMGMIDCLDVWM